MVILWSTPLGNSMEIPCGHPNELSIEHFHGMPNVQPQCKSMESQCITHRTIPWNPQWSIPIQSHRSHLGNSKGITLKALPCCSYGAVAMQVHGNPNALPIKPIHGSPNDQCPHQYHRSHMGHSPCITHKPLPWCSYGPVPMQFHGGLMWRSQEPLHRALPWNAQWPANASPWKIPLHYP